MTDVAARPLRCTLIWHWRGTCRHCHPLLHKSSPPHLRLISPFLAPCAGEQCHGPEPGYFRVCWAWMPHAGALPVAVRRLAERFGSRAKAAGRQGRQDGAGPTGTVVVAAGGGEGSVEVEAASNGAV